MEQAFELWEIEIGRRLARTRNAVEMAEMVSKLVAQHATTMLDALELYIENDDGETIQTLTGRDVSLWAQGTSELAARGVWDRFTVTGAETRNSAVFMGNGQMIGRLATMPTMRRKPRQKKGH